MSESHDDTAGRGWPSGIVAILVLFAVYVLILGPFEWLFRHSGWHTPFARIVQIVYYPLVFLADVTGTIGWLAAYADWWRELG